MFCLVLILYAHICRAMPTLKNHNRTNRKNDSNNRKQAIKSNQTMWWFHSSKHWGKTENLTKKRKRTKLYQFRKCSCINADHILCYEGWYFLVILMKKREKIRKQSALRSITQQTNQISCINQTKEKSGKKLRGDPFSLALQ